MRNAFLVLGVVAWFIAGFFGLYQTTTVEQETPMPPLPQREWARTSVVAPSSVSGATAGGFAIAGGLCFVAAALAERYRPSGQQRSPRAAQMESDAAASIASLEGRTGER